MKKTRRQGTAKANGQADKAEHNNDEDLSERIRTTLATAIGEGALKQATKILEHGIADHFGVSRTVVRSALGVLESDHPLERKKNRSTFHDHKISRLDELLPWNWSPLVTISAEAA